MNEKPPTAPALPGLDSQSSRPATAPTNPKPARPRIKPVERNQMTMRPVDVERLIEEDHPARAIWDFVGQLDLRAYEGPIEAVEGVAGRPAWDPRLLISLWIYAYSRGIGSAREINRRLQYDPAFQWLAGMEVINHHTLSDFRVAYDQPLSELFTHSLGVMSAEGLVSLERIMHDGTKVRACAGADSFRREQTLQAHLEAARQQVEAMGDPRADEPARQRAARQRAARERKERLDKAVEELAKIRQTKNDAQEKEAVRVSLTDPTSRIMKEGGGGYGPNYNVQISTDAKNKIIVGAGVSQNSSDSGELMPAAQRVEENLGKTPGQLVSDGGFTNRQNILDCAGKGIDLIGSFPEHNEQSEGQLKRRGVAPEFYVQAFQYDAQQDCYRCPAGERLGHTGQENRPGVIQHQYRAEASICAQCRFKEQCCPQNASKGRSITRAVEAPQVREFKQKMQTPQAKAIYRQRGAVAEFPNAWIKEKLGLRQFHVRGLLKAKLETLWVCLTYNIQQWIRLVWRVRRLASTG
jgi:transposase